MFRQLLPRGHRFQTSLLQREGARPSRLRPARLRTPGSGKMPGHEKRWAPLAAPRSSGATNEYVLLRPATATNAPPVWGATVGLHAGLTTLQAPRVYGATSGRHAALTASAAPPVGGAVNGCCAAFGRVRRASGTGRDQRTRCRNRPTDTKKREGSARPNERSACASLVERKS